MKTQRLSRIFFVFLMIELICLPGISQDGSADDKPVKKLVEALQNTTNKDSLTIKINQRIKKTTNKGSDLTVTKTNLSTVRVKKPYIHVFLRSNFDQVKEEAKNDSTKLEMFWKQINAHETSSLFKSKNNSKKWKRAKYGDVINIKDILMASRYLQNYHNFLINIQLDGKKNINGTLCYKFVAGLNAAAYEKKVKEMINGFIRTHKIPDLELSIDKIKTDVTFWVRKDSMILEKVSMNSLDTVTMSRKLNGRERSFTIKNKFSIESTFLNYGTTEISKKKTKRMKDILE